MGIYRLPQHRRQLEAEDLIRILQASGFGFGVREKKI